MWLAAPQTPGRPRDRVRHPRQPQAEPGPRLQLRLLGVITHGAADILTVSKDDAAEGKRVLWTTTHNAPEPAERARTRRLMTQRERWTGRRVAVLQTAGDADADLLAQFLKGHTPLL